ncbi:MAG: peptide chain release factor 1 [Candidatus Altiarchaeota archaeon]|nr:peptide chain release factor 1 [Candidatus Altiarchaeota archaeon]
MPVLDVEASLQDFKRKIKQLRNIRGRNTELVTVMVPVGYALHRIVNQISQEKGTAVNIKSKGTRKNVMTALEKTLQHLSLFKKTPDNGLAVFVGNIGEPGKEKWIVESITPPFPLEMRVYRCDQVFFLDPFLDMLKPTDVFGLVIVERRETTLAILRGKRIEIIKTMKSMIPGKFRAGGQSAARFARVREGLTHDFYKKIHEHVRQYLMETKGILLGGPGPTKEELFEVFHKEIQDKVISIQDIGYAGEPGLRELVEKSQDALKETAVERERKLVEELFKGIAMGSKVAYGVAEVQQKLKEGTVGTLILSEDLEEKILEAFEKTAEQLGTKVEYVSTETQSGKEFMAIGGVGALLRR